MSNGRRFLENQSWHARPSTEAATRKMHAEFAGAPIAERHVLRDPPGDAAAVAVLIESARAAGNLAHAIR